MTHSEVWWRIHPNAVAVPVSRVLSPHETRCGDMLRREVGRQLHGGITSNLIQARLAGILKQLTTEKK